MAKNKPIVMIPSSVTIGNPETQITTIVPRRDTQSAPAAFGYRSPFDEHEKEQ
jgi:hypothetical protein